ncbi:MAG: hypothetical protein WDM91_03110 [Rhizomicrobium sp.]
MMFFVFLATISGAAALVQQLAGHGVDPPAAMRWGLSISLLFFGLDHLRTPQRYLPMMPSIVPAPRAVVALTGLCELAGAAGLMVSLLRPAAGWALAIYFVCVFPANIKNAVHGLDVQGLPSARSYYWIRLALQPLAVWWPLYAAGVTTLPFG